jgi:FkbM family methyltransferase
MISRIFDLITIKWLYKKSIRNNKKYQQLAVYTNDFIGSIICTEGYHERFYIEAVQKLLDLLKIKLLLLVDCGANIGNHSLFLGSKFKKVIAIEPNPLLFNLLKINCVGNKYKFLNTAVSENKKKVYLEIFRTNLGGGRVVNKVLNKNHKNIKIITTTLDNILRFEKSITLIKLDVEGHELQVLRGSNSILKKKPIILFEQNSWDTQNSKESAAIFLAKLGYKFIWFKKNDPIEPNSHFIKIFFIFIRHFIWL